MGDTELDVLSTLDHQPGNQSPFTDWLRSLSTFQSHPEGAGFGYLLPSGSGLNGFSESKEVEAGDRKPALGSVATKSPGESDLEQSSTPADGGGPEASSDSMWVCRRLRFPLTPAPAFVQVANTGKSLLAKYIPTHCAHCASRDASGCPSAQLKPLHRRQRLHHGSFPSSHGRRRRISKQKSPFSLITFCLSMQLILLHCRPTRALGSRSPSPPSPPPRRSKSAASSTSNASTRPSRS